MKELKNLLECLVNGTKENEVYTIEMCEFDIKRLANPPIIKLIGAPDYQLMMHMACEIIGIKKEVLTSKTRKTNSTEARQILMRIMIDDLRLMNKSQCGKWLGDRDHATVISGLKHINGLLANNNEVGLQTLHYSLLESFKSYIFIDRIN